jgi:tRNA-specific 2-thiouridylase
VIFFKIEATGMAEKVLTAMSGGVDSAAAALVLKREGYDVAGVTLRLYDATAATPRSCCAPAALKEAAVLARAIGIPHYVLDFREFFRRAVVEDFVAEYGRGRTPNPCIWCNGVVKFERLLALARAMGFARIATGHYVRREYDRDRLRYLLRRAADESKDQSYFLWATPPDNLGDILFPVGGLLKSEVREMLAEVAPAARDKAESQDICFIEDDSYADFVARVAGVGADEGPITDEEGRVLGRHRGIAHYTVGQRRGLGVAGGERMYVKSVDAATNTVVLARGAEIEASTFTATRVNWLVEPESELFRAAAAVRFRDRGAAATLRRKDELSWQVAFDAPRRAIAPGQSAAFYDGDVLLGGGVIDEVAAE